MALPAVEPRPRDVEPGGLFKTRPAVGAFLAMLASAAIEGPGDLHSPHADHGVGWHFGARAVAVVTGLTLLVIVDVQGVGFYFAWGLIGLALVTEAAVTLVYWRRTRGGERSWRQG